MTGYLETGFETVLFFLRFNARFPQVSKLDSANKAKLLECYSVFNTDVLRSVLLSIALSVSQRLLEALGHAKNIQATRRFLVLVNYEKVNRRSNCSSIEKNDE